MADDRTNHKFQWGTEEEGEVFDWDMSQMEVDIPKLLGKAVHPDLLPKGENQQGQIDRSKINTTKSL
ncbi:hypothetical protein [Effusibacillus consociatus]|uniref:Uncharacterized protein n=1 Tax=Effusibacillus consociatus TaxID=1117041 RepID=A0ABV9PWP7_9BACL